jgi:hypothetical protein
MVWRACLAWAGPVLESIALAGLIARGRVRRACLLAVLLIALLVTDVAQALFGWANTWSFWFAKELAHGLLFLGLGIEIMVRVFTPLPGARRSVGAWLLVVLVLALVLAFTLPIGMRALTSVPRLLLAVALLYLGVYGIMLWHMIPVDPLHRAILAGFAPYLLFSAVSWGRVQSRWEFVLADIANPVLFVLVLLALSVAAWRHEGAPPARRSVMRRLWSWR